MSDFESKIDINIDAGQALAAIKTLQRQISDFHTSLAKGSATANIKSLQMQQTLIDTINSTGQFSAQMKTVASSTQAFSTALEKNKLSMSQYFRYAGGASKSFGKFFTTEMETIQKVAIERVKDLQTQYIKMGRDANGALKTIAVRPLALDMENLATKTQIAAQKQQLLNQLLKQGSTNLLNFGKNTQWAGRQLMVGFTIPLGILGTTAVKTFMQMEEQAVKFRRVYGDTFTASEETDAMLKQIKELASEFTKYGIAVEKTMDQAATAAAAGKMGADLLAQVTESTRLAVLGNVEQQQALETTISLTNAFGTATDQLRGKINFLNAVENQTVTSIDDLTIAIPKAAPVIKQLGGDVEDLAFFLTAMREGGINASEGANALKSGLASLINPTDKASKFLQGFGINIKGIVEANKGDVKGLVVDFAKALDTLDPLNRARAIEQLFGKFQFSRLSTLFQNVIKDGTQAARVLELTRQSSAELGILAQRELAKVSSSPMYKFQKAVADFKKELAPVGEEFLKAVTPIIQFGTDILKAFNNLDGGVKQFIVNATGLIAGLGPLFLMTFGLLANGVANVIKGFTFVKNIFNKASSASTILGETTDYMTQQQLEAASVAASLEQVHNKLTQAFTSEASAVARLTTAYQKAVSAQVAFTGPTTAGKGRATKKYADGIFSVPGPKGAGDIIPAMLSPGEAVIPAGPAQKYRGFIKGMIAGKIPGFNKGRIGEDNIDWSSFSKAERDSLTKKLRSAPDALKAEKNAMTWTTKNKEIELIKKRLQELGKTQTIIDRYSQIHASHLKPSKVMKNIGGRSFAMSDFSNASNLTPDVGLINQFTQQISQRVAKGEITSKQIKAIVGKSMTAAEIENQLKRLAAGEHISATPAGNKVLNAVAQHASSGAMKLGVGTKDIAPIVAEITKMRATDTSSKGFLKGIGQRKFSQNVLAKGQVQIESTLRGIYNRAKKMLSDPEYRAAQTANKKAIVAEAQSAQERTKTAKTDKKTAVAKNQAAKAEKKAAVAKSQAAKTEEKNAKKKTATETKATPTVSVKEQLENGWTRTVDANGKEQYRNSKGQLQNKAQYEKANAGASAKPRNRLKGYLAGFSGRLGAAGIGASVLGGAVGGTTGDVLGTVGNSLFLASIVKELMPKGIGGKIAKSGIGQKLAPLFDTFALKLAELTPKLIKFGKVFGGPIALAATVAMGIYDAATADLRKQAEISSAIYKTLNTTKGRLDKINEFFGTTAKMSTARTMAMIPVGFNNKKAFSAAEEFRKSDQFKSEYQDSAQKLAGATNEEFKLAMESLSFDLIASGVGEEQTQAIIDAIKMEAKKTDVVIEVKSLALDTESGFAAAKSNIKASLENFGKEIGNYFNLGGYSISDVMEGRNKGWLESFFGGVGASWNTDNLINQIKQVANVLNGVSAAYLNASIDGKAFDDQIEALADSISKLKLADQVEAYDAILTDLNPTVAELANGLNDTASYGLILKAVLAGITFSPEIIELLKGGQFDIVEAAYKKAKAAQDAQLAQKKALQKQLKALDKQQQEISNNEDEINQKYDDRIKALERIQELNEKIAQQQKNQLDLADALSQGDVFGAAQAMQQMQEDNAAYALQQQKNVIEDQRQKELAVQEKAANNIEKQQADIQDQIANIANAIINIDKFIVYPTGSKDNFKTGTQLADEIAKNKLKAPAPSGGGFNAKDIDWFFDKGKKGNYTGPFGKNGAPSEEVYNQIKTAYENILISEGGSNTGTVNAINVKSQAKKVTSAQKATTYYNWEESTKSPGNKDYVSSSGSSMLMYGQTIDADIPGGVKNLQRGRKIKDSSGQTYIVTDLLALNQNAQYPGIVMLDPVSKADGGHITGPGSGTSDSIPAMLSNGEYVVRAKAVEALGTSFLDKVNYADKFAKGGMVQRFSEGGSPDSIERRTANKNKNGFIDISTWKAISQTQKNTKLSGAERASLISYILSPTTLHYGSFEPNRQDVDRAILNNKMMIPKGTPLARVTSEIDKKAMSILKPGQSFIIDQFMSVTNPADKKFISGMQVGTTDTGGRRAGEKYPLIKYTLAGNVPGIYDMNTILPRHGNERIGKDGYSSVVDGLLARGQTAKLTHITMDEKLGIPIYHVELGGKSRAKTGLFQNLFNYEQKERFRTSTREDRTNPRTLAWLQEKIGLRSTMPRYTGQSTQSNMNIGRMAPTPLLPGGNSSLPSYGWSGSTQKTRVGNYAKGGIVKRDVTSSDPGINWLNQFIQNLLGGGNPSAAMQNDSTKTLLSQSYVQGAKNMGVDPTDPMFYASMFAPSMGLKSLAMAGKGLSKLKGLSSSKASIPTTMTGFKNYLPDAYVNFMRSNPKIAVRMQSERFMDKLSKGDFEYRNRHSSRDLDSMSKPEREDFLSSLQERADIEENVFGIRQDAPGSARPIYGAAVDTRVPWGIRGKQENDLQSAMSMLRGKYSNVSTTSLDRYGDMSLILKNRVKKRSTFTLGDTYSQKNFDGFNGYPGQEWDGYKAAIPAPFGTKSRSQILAADSEVTKNELRFVEAQIFGGLPFSDIKRIIVRNPELIAPLRKSIAQAGLRIPVGESKLSPLGKFIKMLNLKDKSTGLPSFYVPFNEPYKIPKFKNGGMFRTPYAQGGLAMLHDKEFVMNAGAVKDYGLNNLKAMNNGTYNSGSVYNSYGVNINVGGSNANADDIARTVIREIKKIDAQQIRSTKV